MRKFILRTIYLGIILCLTLSACNKPTKTETPPAPNTPTTLPATAPAKEMPTVTATVLAPTEPPAPAPTEITHAMVPGDASGGTPIYDSESYSNASLKYANNGDIYRLNRFERPFTAKDMVYLPFIDILSFNISRNEDWFFINVELADLANFTEGLEPVFGAEIDHNFDGRGDFLLWAAPPFNQEWSTNHLKVYEDANQDVGGDRPDQADDKPGDGYEKLIFDSGQGDDPDLAWVRIDPANPNFIQFAFKQVLIPNNPANGFEAAVWADASNLKDPAKFAYNDLMTIETAGSPLKDDVNYPLKEIYAVDSTCYRNFLTITGYPPLLCSVSEEKVKRPPRDKGDIPVSGPPSSVPPPPAGCVPQPNNPNGCP